MLLRCLSFAALVTSGARDGLAQARAGKVDITIEVASPNLAHVEGRYVVTGRPPPIALRLLMRPCATIENMRIERNGLSPVLTQSRNGPWITVRDSTSPAVDTLQLFARYDVRLAGAGVIPLLHLAAAVKGDSARVEPVSVTVHFADAGGGVDFPHMSRQAPDEWSARYVAVPSFVQLASSNRCDESVGEPGDNGGLVWRFFLLVGIMVAWVPLYLAWARRSSAGDRA